MNKTSINVRFLSTVTANVLRVIIVFVAGLVIARFLGPSEYGDFNFLMGSFLGLIALVDMGSGHAFYTFISKKQRGTDFFIYYSIWIIIQLSLLFLLVLFLPAFLMENIWLGHSRKIILFALFASFAVNKIWRFAAQIGESIRDTIGVQIRNLLMVTAYLICTLLLAVFDVVTLKNLFILNIIMYSWFTIYYGLRLYRTGTFSHEQKESLSYIVGEFKSYCFPLVSYTFIGFFYSFFDYWFLQKTGGSVQQGYYAIGARFASISLIATISMVQVFWKEISEAYAVGNIQQVQKLYSLISQGLFFFSAVCSCFLMPFGRDILFTLLGPAYQDAWLPLTLMFFYPIHQSLGQISGIALLAIEKTKTKSYIGIFFMALSVMVTYFMLAPENMVIPGLNMGATGLALKMVICQLVEVNLTIFFVAKYLTIPFKWLFQINILSILIPLSFIIKYVSQWILSSVMVSPHFIIVMIFSLFLYLGAVIAVFYYFPSIAGMNRGHIDYGLGWIRKKLNLTG